LAGNTSGLNLKQYLSIVFGLCVILDKKVTVKSIRSPVRNSSTAEAAEDVNMPAFEMRNSLGAKNICYSPPVTLPELTLVSGQLDPEVALLLVGLEEGCPLDDAAQLAPPGRLKHTVSQ